MDLWVFLFYLKQYPDFQNCGCGLNFFWNTCIEAWQQGFSGLNLKWQEWDLAEGGITSYCPQKITSRIPKIPVLHPTFWELETHFPQLYFFHTVWHGVGLRCWDVKDIPITLSASSVNWAAVLGCQRRYTSNSPVWYYPLSANLSTHSRKLDVCKQNPAPTEEIGLWERVVNTFSP